MSGCQQQAGPQSILVPTCPPPAPLEFLLSLRPCLLSLPELFPQLSGRTQASAFLQLLLRRPDTYRHTRTRAHAHTHPLRPWACAQGPARLRTLMVTFPLVILRMLKPTVGIMSSLNCPDWKEESELEKGQKSPGPRCAVRGGHGPKGCGNEAERPGRSLSGAPVSRAAPARPLLSSKMGHDQARCPPHTRAPL